LTAPARKKTQRLEGAKGFCFALASLRWPAKREWFSASSPGITGASSSFPARVGVGTTCTRARRIYCMKVIGLIGGMSWESTAEYYRLINEAVRERLGGLHSAPCLLYSVDFEDVALLQRQGQWAAAAALLTGVAQKLEGAGAGLVLICTNTMHKVADAVQAGIRVPLVHIVDATAASIRRAGIGRVGLLGTRFTMEEEFYRGRLAGAFGVDVVIPDPADRETVHRVIFDELCVGVTRPESKAALAGIMSRLVERGAQGIVLGCTELDLLVGPGDCPVPLFDTTREHALAAVDEALR